MTQGMESRSQTVASGEAEARRYTVLVDPVTPLEEQCAQAGFLLEGLRAEVRPWGPYTTPAEPYQAKISDGLDTKGKTWEKAMKGMSKGDCPTTVFEGIALAKEHPEILDGQRMTLPGTAHDLYDIFQIEKRSDGKIVVRPLFVGDTNTDHKTDPATNLPFAVLFTSR